MKVISVVGARPNYIKLAAVYEVFSKCFDHVVVDTGQHYDYEMNKIFFNQFSIPEPDYFLGVGSGSHGYQIGEMVKRIEKVLFEEKPDSVIVYGDTNSTLAGALAAVKTGFRVAHIEAGLRSYNISMPEEINRRVVDHISYLLFAPTMTAYNNLVSENVPGKPFLTGDVHVDILVKWIKVAKERSNVLHRLGLEKEKYIVATIHRVENVDNPNVLKKITEIIKNISKYIKIIFPIHPRTRKRLLKYGLFKGIARNNNVVITDPLGYIDFIKLLKYCNRVVTDSGGVQREAYLLRKPVVILRRNTEWIELLKAGWAILVDPSTDIDTNLIIEWRPENYVKGLLGDGKSAIKITEILLNARSD